MDQAMTVGAPVIGLNDSGGARIQVIRVCLKFNFHINQMVKLIGKNRELHLSFALRRVKVTPFMIRFPSSIRWKIAADSDTSIFVNFFLTDNKASLCIHPMDTQIPEK